MRFDGKVVFIVGGNSGIGLAAAKRFAAEGATTVLTGRDPQTLEQATADVPRAIAFRCDIADPATLEPALQHVQKQHGRIDALFVNAGIGAFASVQEATPELWDKVHAVNSRGCFFAIQKSLPLMRSGSAIVVTGSIGAVLAIPGNVIYAAAKAGLRAVARTLALELVSQGIRVNMVSPGPIETPLINRNVGMSPAEVGGLRQQMIANIPMRRMGEAEEVANAVVFLASHEASFITGVDLYVDGGCVEL